MHFSALLRKFAQFSAFMRTYTQLHEKGGDQLRKMLQNAVESQDKIGQRDTFCKQNVHIDILNLLTLRVRR